MADSQTAHAPQPDEMNAEESAQDPSQDEVDAVVQEQDEFVTNVLQRSKPFVDGISNLTRTKAAMKPNRKSKKLESGLMQFWRKTLHLPKRLLTLPKLSLFGDVNTADNRLDDSAKMTSVSRRQNDVIPPSDYLQDFTGLLSAPAGCATRLGVIFCYDVIKESRTGATASGICHNITTLTISSQNFSLKHKNVRGITVRDQYRPMSLTYRGPSTAPHSAPTRTKASVSQPQSRDRWLRPRKP
ncbi:unnamed protein product, partial [Nesidiocoris tenuis]